MSPYASRTEVPVSRTQQEIEKLLIAYGATEYVRGWSEGRAGLQFVLGGRQVRIDLPLPDGNERAIGFTPSGRARSAAQVEVALEAEVRRRWRALLAVLKAKLVAVEDGISTIEREFLADVVLPNGQTIGAWAAPQIELAYETRTMPELLPGGGS